MEELLGCRDRIPVLAGARQFAADRPADRRSHPRAFLDGGVHLCAPALLRRPLSLQLPSARTAVSRGDGDFAAVHQDPRSRIARFLLGRHPAAGRLFPRDGHSPFAHRLQAAADRTLGRGDDGWLRVLPLLFLHHAPAFGTDPVDRRRDLVRRQLERLLAAPRRAQQRSHATHGRLASWAIRANT